MAHVLPRPCQQQFSALLRDPPFRATGKRGKREQAGRMSRGTLRSTAGGETRAATRSSVSKS
eukprot:4194818-Heterocapsa_arctica.AAC.1